MQMHYPLHSAWVLVLLYYIFLVLLYSIGPSDAKEEII